MNKIRRKNLQTIIDRLEDIRPTSKKSPARKKNTATISPKTSRAAKSTNALMKRVTI